MFCIFFIGDLHESDSSRAFWRPPAPGNNNTFYFEIVLIYVLFSVTNQRIFFFFLTTRALMSTRIYTLNKIGSLEGTLQYYFHATPGEAC